MLLVSAPKFHGTAFTGLQYDSIGIIGKLLEAICLITTYFLYVYRISNAKNSNKLLFS